MTRLGAYKLMTLIMDLSYIYERCRSVGIIPSQAVQVKGDNYLLDVLRRQQPFVSAFTQRYNLNSIADEVRDWIAYLDRRYVQQSALFGPPINLQPADANRLMQDVGRWKDAILSIYNSEGTVLIKESNLDSIFSKEFWGKLEEMAKNDLNDAIMCVLHLLPTPAAMISLRVAEHIIRRHYEKVAISTASNKSWAQLLQELEQKQLLKPAALGYARFLKDKRNEAEHPHKRFTQEEGERILLNIKDLLAELEK